ncbi:MULTISPECIES: hypothetical protein [Lysobacter]|uniref:hypothetical protein n=1 Tax=Lysobacter TaxID=68 RepID=UPI00126A0468|nr:MULTISPECIES: hypothetical protein [Lysobacter]
MNARLREERIDRVDLRIRKGCVVFSECAPSSRRLLALQVTFCRVPATHFADGLTASAALVVKPT